MGADKENPRIRKNAKLTTLPAAALYFASTLSCGGGNVDLASSFTRCDSSKNLILGSDRMHNLSGVSFYADSGKITLPDDDGSRISEYTFKVVQNGQEKIVTLKDNRLEIKGSDKTVTAVGITIPQAVNSETELAINVECKVKS